MKKRFVLFAIMAAVLVCLLAVGASAVSDVVAEGFTGPLKWKLYSDGELVISGASRMPSELTYTDVRWYDHRMQIKTVTIESGVTSIGDYAFYGCTNLKSVNLPDSIDMIGRYAFYACKNLQSIKIPDSVKDIYDYAFCFCSGLTDIDLPNSATLGEFAFHGCAKLQSIDIPEGITELPKDLFSYCSNLTIVNLPDTLVRIGEAAFFKCTSLTEINIPMSVEYIYDKVFYECTALSKVIVNSSDTGFGINVFCGVSSTFKLYGHKASWGDLYASENALAFVEISDRAVYKEGTYGENIGWVLFEDGGLVVYGEGAIPDVSNIKWTDKICIEYDPKPPLAPWYIYRSHIKTIFVDYGISRIGNWAFLDCGNVSLVTISDSVDSIGVGAFRKCKGISKIIMGQNVRSLEEYAFAECGILNIELPDSLKTAQYRVFYNTHLRNLIINSYDFTFNGSPYDTTPTYLKVYGYPGSKAQAFAEANGRELFAIEGRYVIDHGECRVNVAFNDLAWTLYSDGEIVISGSGEMMEYANEAAVPWHAYRSQIKKVTLKQRVFSVGAYAFSNCDNLTEVDMPGISKLSSIGDFAFSSCDNLTRFVVPTNVKYIGKNAFSSCCNLAKVTILSLPGAASKLENIGDNAFSMCGNLTSIEIPYSIINIGQYAFSDCSNLTKATIYSRTAIFGSNVFAKTFSTFAIYAYAGSTAEAYANANGHTFVALPEHVGVPVVAPTVATVTTADGNWYEGENTFTVTCDKPCRVFVSSDGGATYERLTATANANGGYDFTANLTAESEIVVRLAGDISGNGVLAANDYSTAKKILLDANYYNEPLTRALLDTNGDGRILVNDITLIRRILLGYTVAW